MLSIKRSIVFSVLMFLGGIVFAITYMAVVSPQAIMWPKIEHAHFRMQLVVEGEAVNFGDAKFQQQAGTGVCTDELAAEPIHFHDNKDQLVHLHWKGMTGGLVLKNYGWNLIGGIDSVLGYRFDQLPLLPKVPIYGDVLPPQPAETTIWVYTGDEHGFKVRKTADFLWEDMETFFGTKSTVNPQHVTRDLWRDLLFSRAGAHDGEVHTEGDHTQEGLVRANNLLGNVVIFVQNDPPADAQVKERFENLAPLEAGSCSG